MVVDCFPFANEFELLTARLELLSPLVDVFLIQEVGRTHAGSVKGLLLSLDHPSIKQFRSKIVLLQRDDFDSEISPFERDWWQRDLADPWLTANMKPDDILIYGDVDEIPDPQALEGAIETIESGRSSAAFLAMDMHYCFIDFRESTGRLISALGEFNTVKGSNRRWIGTGVWAWKEARKFKPAQLRGRQFVDINQWVRIDEGGWHLSYVDGPIGGFARFQEKLRITAHQEFNTKEVLSQFMRRVKLGKDPLGRRFVRFERLSSLEHLPAPLKKMSKRRPDMLIDSEPGLRTDVKK